jgi:hypothetical protein
MPVTQEYDFDLGSGQMFMTTNGFNPVKVALRTNAVVPCEGELILLLFISWQDSSWWARASPLPRLHDHTQDTPHSAGLLWTSDRPDAETST